MSNPQHVHSKLSFSARYRWRACPLSVHLSANIAEQTSSPVADEGTAAHLVGEFYVKKHFKLLSYAQGLDECPDVRVIEGLDRLNIADPAAVAAWQEQLRTHGKDYLAFVRSLIPDDEPDAYVSVETPVNIRSIHVQLFGTLDLRIWLPKRRWLIIVDYKYGFQDVEIGAIDDPNPQLAAYAIASIEALNETVRGQLQGITLAVYQPRVPLGDPRKVLHLPVTWIEQERQKLRNEVAAVENPGAPRPGDHCRYCPAKASCPAVHNALQIALDAYAGGPNVLAMTDDQIIDLWSARKAVESLMSDVDERARKLANNGHKRMKVTSREGNRMIKDEKNAVLTLLSLGRTDLLRPCTMTELVAVLPQAWQNELIGRNPPIRSVSLLDAPAPNVVRDMFKQYTEKK